MNFGAVREKGVESTALPPWVRLSFNWDKVHTIVSNMFLGTKSTPLSNSPPLSVN